MTGPASRLMAALIAGALCAPAQAQLFWTPPDFRGPPVTGAEPGVGLPLPGATPKELDAHLLWNMRAGLNVAALQCQFSPTLGTVKNYNDLLAHHAKEFRGAYTALQGYFTRTKGKGRPGQTAFDQYTTKTYNGFSTLHAQRGFCQTASEIGREALTKPKGQLLTVARLRLSTFRNSLVPAFERVFTMVGIPEYPTPRLDDACWNKTDLLKASCGNWHWAAAPASGSTAPTTQVAAARIGS